MVFVTGVIGDTCFVRGQIPAVEKAIQPEKDRSLTFQTITSVGVESDVQAAIDAGSAEDRGGCR